jgi:hypothetical protein
MFSKNRRGILWLLLLVSLSAAGIGAVLLLRPSLPDPAVADRDELLRWLVTRDLAKESPETRLTLVRRLEGEFRRGVDWEALKRKSTEAQRRRLWNNIPLLFGPWLTDKASIYSRLPSAQRPKFIDDVLDSLLAWRGVDRLQVRKDGNAAQGGMEGLLSVFFAQVEECSRNAEPQQRDHIAQFVAAVQLRFLMR